MSVRLVCPLETGVERLLGPATSSKATVSNLRALRLRLESAHGETATPLGNDVRARGACERARRAGTLGAARAWDAGIVTYMRMFLSPLEPSPQLLFFFCLLTALTTFLSPARPSAVFRGGQDCHTAGSVRICAHMHTRFLLPQLPGRRPHARREVAKAGAPHNSPDSEAPS